MTTAIIIFLVLFLVLFVVLYIVANKKYKTLLEKLKELNKREEEWSAQYAEDQRMIRSYEMTMDNYENFIKEVSSELPKKRDSKTIAMKLANELSPYFKVDEENNSVSIKLYTRED